MQEKIKKYLDRPFHLLAAEKYCWFYILGVALIIIVLINLLQPFGLYEWRHPAKLLILSGFGWTFAVLTAFLFIAMPQILPAKYNAANWTLGMELRSLLILFLSAGVVNWLYALAVFPYVQASWNSFILIQIYSFELGLMPVMGLVLLAESQSQQQNRKPVEIEVETAGEIIQQNSTPIPTVDVVSINGKELAVCEILYLQACQNYVDVHLRRNGKKEKQMVRTTIKGFEYHLSSYPQFVRCHKSFMVNTGMVENAKGNSQGWVLQLLNCNETVPVSRKFIPRMKEIISPE